MAANTAPIYPRQPQIEWGATALTAANTAKDGTGTVLTVFTGSAEGSYADKIVFRPAGTNVQTVARLFLNNGSTNATAANNILIKEFTLPAITLSETTSQQDFEFALNLPIPPGYKLNVVLGTAVAAGYYVSVVGGIY